MYQRRSATGVATKHGFAHRSFVVVALIGLLFSLTPSTRLKAEVFEAGGLTFSDELGGFRLLSATGSGTVADPIILVEEMINLRPAVLVVRRARAGGMAAPGSRVLLRSLIKIVINRSAFRWSGFDLELRNGHGLASVYSDGLSFDQPRAIPMPLHSDLFAASRTEDEPYDRVFYDQGSVEPDQAVRLAFNLIDLNPRPLFYLAQAPVVLLTDRRDLPGEHRSYAGFARRSIHPSHRSFNAPISP